METLILIYALSFAFTLGLYANEQVNWFAKVVGSIFSAFFIPFLLAYAFGKLASETRGNGEE